MAGKGRGRKPAGDQAPAGDSVVTPTLQGVSRALRVLDEVAKRPMRTSDLAEALGISWATLHRTLAQLETDGFIRRDESGLFHVGRKTWLLGSTYLLGHKLLEMAIPLLSRGSSEVPSAVLQLVERSDGTSVVLYSREATSGEIITRTTYGYHFPLHCGSKGHVLLAYSPKEYVDEYLAGPLMSLTAATITDPAELRKVLAKVRDDGYSVTVSDVQSFTGSVSAPVFDAAGEVQACVCAVVQRSVLAGDRRELVIDLVLRLAQALSLGMGWQPLAYPRGSNPAG